MENFEIEYLYEDDHIVVVNKPVDLPVHKNDFMPNDAPYLTKIVGDRAGKWVYNVHRLDSKTSGIMVLTYSKEAAHNLALQFEQKKVQKTYFAVVLGNPGSGTYNSKVLVKKKTKFKKPAITHFKTIKSIPTQISYKDKNNVELSLVEINPETGRWHQLRQHFAQNKHDILGDSHHGDFTLNKIVSSQTGIMRLFLHAGALSFVHPETTIKLNFTSELPAEFKLLLQKITKPG